MIISHQTPMPTLIMAINNKYRQKIFTFVDSNNMIYRIDDKGMLRPWHKLTSNTYRKVKKQLLKVYNSKQSKAELIDSFKPRADYIEQKFGEWQYGQS